MRKITAWVWNADEADYGMLLLCWGIAVAWKPWPIGFALALSIAAVAVGIGKITLSVTRLGKRSPWSKFRPGLAQSGSAIWLAACLLSVVNGWGAGWGGWAAVLYLWLSYRSGKQYLRLTTRLVADAVLEATHDEGG